MEFSFAPFFPEHLADTFSRLSRRGFPVCGLWRLCPRWRPLRDSDIDGHAWNSDAPVSGPCCLDCDGGYDNVVEVLFFPALAEEEKTLRPHPELMSTPIGPTLATISIEA